MSENKTAANLMSAFAGESQANRKYTAYAKKAEAEGKKNAAKLFRAAADAETLHALKEFEVAGKVHTTSDNLKDAVAGETHEYKSMYPDFIAQANEEGTMPRSPSFPTRCKLKRSTRSCIRKRWTPSTKPRRFSTICARFAETSKKPFRIGARSAAFRETNLLSIDVIPPIRGNRLS
jgi:rubrerythrin